jgi:hypothetical protein
MPFEVQGDAPLTEKIAVRLQPAEKGPAPRGCRPGGNQRQRAGAQTLFRATHRRQR